MSLPTLTIWQPWASLIAEGVKTIETRSWKAPDDLVGRYIGIHAATRVPTPERGPMFVGDFHVAQGGTWLHGPGVDVRMPLGAIVATARLTACVPTDSTEDPPDDCLYVTIGQSGLFRQIVTGDPWNANNVKQIDLSDQLPYGDFSLNRWGWMLDNIAPTTERCPWCMGCGDRCPVCLDACRCDPVPAKGKQRVWRWTP